MSSLCAIRKETSGKKHEGWIQYKFSALFDINDVNIQENTYLVDGIGGVTWVSLCVLPLFTLNKLLYFHFLNVLIVRMGLL